MVSFGVIWNKNKCDEQERVANKFSELWHEGPYVRCNYREYYEYFRHYEEEHGLDALLKVVGNGVYHQYLLWKSSSKLG